MGPLRGCCGIPRLLMPSYFFVTPQEHPSMRDSLFTTTGADASGGSTSKNQNRKWISLENAREYWREIRWNFCLPENTREYWREIRWNFWLSILYWQFFGSALTFWMRLFYLHLRSFRGQHLDLPLHGLSCNPSRPLQSPKAGKPGHSIFRVQKYPFAPPSWDPFKWPFSGIYFPLHVGSS